MPYVATLINDICGRICESAYLGDAWIRELRTAVLVVPSVVARGEGNVLINPRHPDFNGIVASAPEPVVWDARLFAAR